MIVNVEKPPSFYTRLFTFLNPPGETPLPNKGLKPLVRAGDGTRAAPQAEAGVTGQTPAPAGPGTTPPPGVALQFVS